MTEVEFIHAISLNDSNEMNGKGETGVDMPFFTQHIREMEAAGFDQALLAYGAATQDPFSLAAVISQHSERLGAFVALRPNLVYPTFAAKALATLDQVSAGRVALHLIAGGRTAEQAREGDRLGKSERYARMGEYLDIARKTWSSAESFDHSGEYYSFEDFHSAVKPVQDHIRIGVGGASPEAQALAGAKADFFGMWGEPMDPLRSLMDNVDAAAAAAGRAAPPKYWATFRPIVAATNEQAWEKAHRIVHTLRERRRSGLGNAWTLTTVQTESTATKRILDMHESGIMHDRATWLETSKAAAGIGTTTGLVGDYETVAAAMLDYIEMGVSMISMRGYFNQADMIEYGKHLLPLVRQELAHRKNTGQRGEIVPQPDFVRGPHPVDIATVPERAEQRS
ncbi:MAG: LLM class flavin-dependent oxidoreductase [Leucobacter sp.]